MADVALTDEELDSVAAVMAAAGSPPAARLVSRLIAGGRSNLTFRLDDGEQSWVLRTPPRSGRTPSAHDVGREYRVTAALGNTPVAVAHAVAYCDDESLLGGPFAVWSFVEGRCFQTGRDLDDLDDVRLARAVEALVSTLAVLHQTDHVAVGLGGYGRTDAYAARQLRRWAGQWEHVGEPALRPLAMELRGRLERHVPEQLHVGVVHGDYRIDNTLLDLREDGRVEVAAVVDWELSTIGDPVADVAMMCAYRHPALDLIVGAPGAWTSDRLPAPGRIAELYVAAGGVPLDAWDFHLALAYYKIAVIAAGIAHRVNAGAASGPGFNTAGETVGTYLELGLETLGLRA